MLPTANRIGAVISVSGTGKWFSPWGRLATAMALRLSPSTRSIVSSPCAANKIVRNWTEVQCCWGAPPGGAWARVQPDVARYQQPCALPSICSGPGGHRDDYTGGTDSWGTLMAYLPMPEGGGPNEPWCTSCKAPIKDGQLSVRIAFDHDPHGYGGLTGIYHVHCSRPFQSLAHALRVLSFRSF